MTVITYIKAQQNNDLEEMLTLLNQGLIEAGHDTFSKHKKKTQKLLA